MYKKTFTMLALTVVGVMSLGSSCSNVTEGIARSGGLSGLGIGDSRTDGLVQAGAKGAQALGTYDAGEQELTGQTIAASLFALPGVIDDDKLSSYVTKVGLAIVSVTGRNDIDYSFGILSDSKINAISAPRGYVFITKGALAQMKDESELAGVLAHEIAHVVKDHGMEAVRNDKGIDALLTGAGAATRNPWAQVGANLANKWKGVLYNPNQENDADKLAVKYLKDAGYDPTALERFLARTGTGSGGQFSSHPAIADRLTKLRTEAGAAKGQQLADRFAASVK